MPIKGLMEQRGRLPVLGKIRLGVMAKSARGVEYPKEVAYFVVPPELVPLTGEQPTEIRVRFPTSDPEKICDAWYLRYDAGKLGRRCDGATFEEIPKDGGSPQTGQCVKESKRPCVCRATATARMSVIVDGGPVGVYWVLLGGEQRIADVQSGLEFHRSLLEGYGKRLSTFPFKLVRVPTQEGFIKDGKRAVREGFPVQVRALYSWEDLVAGGPAALIAGHPRAALAGETVAPADVEADPDHPDEPAHADDPETEGAHVEAEDAEVVPAGARADSTVPGEPDRGVLPTAAPAGAAQAAPAPAKLLGTREALVETAARCGLSESTLGQYVKARFPALTEVGTPGAYGVLIHELEVAIAGGDPGKSKYKGDCFKAMKAAAKGTRA